MKRLITILIYAAVIGFIANSLLESAKPLVSNVNTKLEQLEND